MTGWFYSYLCQIIVQYFRLTICSTVLIAQYYVRNFNSICAMYSMTVCWHNKLFHCTKTNANIESMTEQSNSKSQGIDPIS